MSIWKYLNKTVQKEKEDFNLKQRFRELLKDDVDEERLTKMACIAGLLARTAYSDHNVCENEEEHMRAALNQWTDLSDNEINAITKMAIEDIKELAGLEDYYYAQDLIALTSQKERFALIESLFQLAAADGKVESKEEEEIRQICKHLRLSHQHYISARSKVLEFIGSLQLNKS